MRVERGPALPSVDQEIDALQGEVLVLQGSATDVDGDDLDAEIARRPGEPRERRADFELEVESHPTVRGARWVHAPVIVTVVIVTAVLMPTAVVVVVVAVAG